MSEQPTVTDPVCPTCGHLEYEHEDYDVDGVYVSRSAPDWQVRAVTRHVCPVECENEECPVFQRAIVPKGKR